MCHYVFQGGPVYLRIGSVVSSAARFQECVSVSGLSPGTSVTLQVEDSTHTPIHSSSFVLCGGDEYNVFAWDGTGLKLLGSSTCTHSAGTTSSLVLFNMLAGTDNNIVTYSMSVAQAASIHSQPNADVLYGQYASLGMPSGKGGSIQSTYFLNSISHSSTTSMATTTDNSLQVVSFTGNLNIDPTSAQVSVSQGRYLRTSWSFRCQCNGS